MAEETTAVFDHDQWKSFIKDLNKKLVEIKDGHKKYAAMLSAIVFADVVDHFKKEMGPTGKWKAWSLSYAGAIAGRIAFRRYRGRTVPLDEYAIAEQGIKPPRKPGMILQDTGRLRNSFKKTNVRRVSSGFQWFNNAKVKSGFPYAFAHNEGGPRLPRRRFMWLSEEAVTKAGEQTLNFLLEET